MRTLFVVVCLLFVGWAFDAPAQEVLPPCCGSPPSIEFLEARPPGEKDLAFIPIYRGRLAVMDGEELQVELGSIQGACAQTCPQNFRWALSQISAEMASRPPIDDNPFGPPCCTPVDPPKSGRSTKPRVLPLTLPSPRANVSVNSREFADRLLLALQSWTGTLDTVPVWLDVQLEGAGSQRLLVLDAVLGGRCSQQPACSPAMQIGRERIVRLIEDRHRFEDRRDQVSDLTEMVNVTLKVALIGAAVSILVGLGAAVMSLFQAAGADKRLRETLARLDASLGQIARPSDRKGKVRVYVAGGGPRPRSGRRR